MAHDGAHGPMFVAIVLCAVAITGCGNFENPLTWDESPIATDLPGTWRGIEGDEAGAIVAVSRAEDRGLRFRITYPEGTPATVKQGKDKHRAEFRADLLGFGSLAVLQIEASTYEEFDEDGSSLGSADSGYLFRRVKPLPDGNMSLHRLDRTMLGEVAEVELGDSGLRLHIETVSGCMSEDMSTYTFGQSWKAITDGLPDELKAEVIAALGENDDAAREFERELAKLDNLEVDPYRELARLRTCIARHLPSESLERLFSSHTDRVFAGGVDRFARQ